MSSHLTLDQLTMDPSDLSPAARRHLESCPKCRVEAKMMRMQDGPEVTPGTQNRLTAHRRMLTADVKMSMVHTTAVTATFAGRPEREIPEELAPDRFAIRGWLGAGSCTQVYTALDRHTGRPCVLKLRRAQAVSPALKPIRAQLFSAIEHTNLCRMIGLMEDGTQVVDQALGPDFISWVCGATDHAHHRGNVDIRRLRNGIAQVVTGLSALEDAGIIHGRIHPGNIRVDGAGRVIVMDYGLPPKSMDAQTAKAASDRAIYVAPELRVSGGHTHQGDIYSLGVVLGEALLGIRPRDATSLYAPPAGIPGDLVALAQAMLHSDPSARPNLNALREHLRVDALPTEASSGRYDLLEPIAEGGMGEVRRVLDRELQRTLAMKIAHDKLQSNPKGLSRFVAEAQLTAQLQHPGIVPVHEIGRLEDGRTYFTMKEIEGGSLLNAIAQLHSGPPKPEDPWSIRRLVSALHRVCEALAYAHGRGILHRDIKPENIMVGPYGETLLVDWGIAKAVEDSDTHDPVLTDRSARGTRMGTVPGTPAYMAPELLRPVPANASKRTDVYAMGATLYQALTGRPPYIGRSAEHIALMVIDTDPPDLDQASLSGQPIPAQLKDICMKAMARKPKDRPADAAALAQILAEWLDGALARDKALTLVHAAEAVYPQIEAYHETAAALSHRASALMGQVSQNAPVSEKTEAWALEDQAKEARLQATLATVEFEKTLRAALSHAPEFPPALELLASHHRALHHKAEAASDIEGAARHMALLRAYDQGRHKAYVTGMGELSLDSAPSGATVKVLRYEEVERRLVLRHGRDLGATPLDSVQLPMGSYQLVIEAQGHATVRLPIRIGRLDHQRNIPPGQTQPRAVRMPTVGALQPDDVFIPAGWSQIGGDNASMDALPLSKVWVDDFIVRRHPITNGQYIAFLDDLVAQGREDEALEHVPRERAATLGEDGVMIYGRRADGTFELRPDADGDLWVPDMPVVMITWFGARAFANWEARRTGRPWRLPWEVEWERSARGADGRAYPWGEVMDPTFCCMRNSHGERAMVATTQQYPTDESPFGVRGMAGNVIDWCNDAYRPEGPSTVGDAFSPPPCPAPEDEPVTRLIRGGGWVSKPSLLRCASRDFNDDFNRASYVGFRLFRSCVSEDFE